MRICLVSPPTITEFTESQVTDSEAIRLIAERAPMGILSLAAVLEKIGIVPTIVDLNQLYYEYAGSEKNHRGQISFCEFVAGLLESPQFDVFGFSTVCSSYPLTIRLAGEVKRTHPDAAIILGGPQASVVDVQTLKAFPAVDLIVRGEAEETLPRVLEALSGIVSYDVIPGITFRRGDGIVRKPNAPVIADLDNLPLAAFHLYPYIERCRYLPLEIGRGCPFACSFCSTNDFFRRQFRLKSPEKVVQEMKMLNGLYGIRTFDLIHDMFTVNRKKVVAFCEMLKRSGEKFYWGCSARTDCIDDELIDLMAAAGCNGIFFGIDSGSEQMQRIMNKRLDLSAAALRIERTNRRGIKTTVSLITGFPEETKDDLRATIRFLGDSLRLDNAEPQLHLLAPLAETPITTQYKDSLLFDDIFSDISHQGWQQEVPDREMIRSYPDIFTNFYAVPTLWLDRTYLKELREFILKGMRKFRWLFVALHQDCGDLLRVFDQWKSWYPEHLGANLFSGGDMRSYYLGDSFRDDFLNFVRTHYLQTMARYPVAVSTVLDYQTALGCFDEAFESPARECSTELIRWSLISKTTAKPVRAANIQITQSNMDFEELLSCLRKKGKLDQLAVGPVTLVFRPVKGKVEVVQLSEHTDRLLDLCDGAHTIDEIAKSFSLTEQSTPQIPADKVCLFGLALLQERGLIEVPHSTLGLS
jgi:radical SAM superfamily enzyme YgiQ (UPF0313 family)